MIAVTGSGGTVTALRNARNKFMTKQIPEHALALHSTFRNDGTIQLTLDTIAVPEPRADEVLVRVDATPINPSDLGMLLGAADVGTARESGTPAEPVITIQVPEAARGGMAARLEKAMPVGNEGAGVVVAAGSSQAAQALQGKTVALLAGGMYAQYRCVSADQALALPAGTTAAAGASCFVNPLTALGMVETMKLEGHSALVHTAAASNLGQMLNRICLKDGIDLVNIVRKKEQEDLLRGIGARFVCNSSSESFLDDLTDTLADTGATLAFDAIGGGKLASQILSCMEAALNRRSSGYQIYGSPVHKQVYIYGGLGMGPTVLTRNYGLAWSVGGWLVTDFLNKIGAGAAQKMKERVAAEVSTTFASRYSREISLPEALSLDQLMQYARMATGEKFLINPNKGVGSN